MDKLLAEIPNAASYNASIGGISVSRDESRGNSLYSTSQIPGHPLPSYIVGGFDNECGYCIGPNIGRFSEGSLSLSGASSTSRTPSPTEIDEGIWLPDLHDHRSKSAMRLAELQMMEKLQLMHVRDNLAQSRSIPARTIVTDPTLHRGPVLPDFLPLDDLRTPAMVYSNGWIGDQRGFSCPSHFKTRSPDAYGDILDDESYIRRKANNVYLNPALRLLNSDGSLNNFHSKVQYVFPLPNGKSPRSLDDFRCEDSFIMKDELLPSNVSNESFLTDKRRTDINEHMWFQQLRPSSSMLLKKETIYQLAKDQDGCRFLQKIFEENKAESIDSIYYGVIDHAGELMENPFGNYLMQKLFELCSIEQRIQIILILTENPSELIRISLNTHGTRAVQKLIETLKTRQEILLITSALKPGFLKLVKDLNGNHVVQKCLVSLKAEDNKFIFDAAAKHCVEIATHRHGCCVLQCCISRSVGDYSAKLFFEISANGLLLARDAFGNYVVQYILDLENESANASLQSQFKGNYVELSMQKFSSNVVEKCLKVFDEEGKAVIISELLHKEAFEHLLQDPFANYVVQSALFATKGSSLYAALARAIRPLGTKLKTNPYCRRIFSKILRNDY